MANRKPVPTTAFVVIHHFAWDLATFVCVSKGSFGTLPQKEHAVLMPVLYFPESGARCRGWSTAARRARHGRCGGTGRCGTAASRDSALPPGAPPPLRCASPTAGICPRAAPVRPQPWKLSHWHTKITCWREPAGVSLLCFLPRDNLLHFEWSSSWRFLSCEKNIWRRRRSSLFLWQTLFCHWIWLNSMLWFWVVSRPSSVWRYPASIVLCVKFLEKSSHLLSRNALWIQNKDTVCSLNVSQVLVKRAGSQGSRKGSNGNWNYISVNSNNRTDTVSYCCLSKLNLTEAGVDSYREFFRPWSSINCSEYMKG